MNRHFVLAFCFAIFLLSATAQAALPPLTPEELDQQADVIVTGNVVEANTSIERKSHSSIYVVELSTTIESVEKGQGKVAAGDSLTIHCWTIRTTKMAGPSGHGDIPGEGSGFRMWLRKNKQGFWEPLEPNGIALLQPEIPISYKAVEKQRIRTALIIGVPVLAGMITVIVVQFGKKRG